MEDPGYLKVSRILAHQGPWSAHSAGRPGAACECPALVRRQGGPRDPLPPLIP